MLMKFINDLQNGRYVKDPTNHGTETFPVAVYKLKDSPKELFPGSYYLHLHPHYHDVFEIFYLRKGKCTYCINGNKYEINEGSLIFDPPKAIHYAYIGSSKSNTVNLTTVFRSSFLTGIGTDVVSQEYLFPVLNNSMQKFPIISPDVPWQNEIIKKYKEFLSLFEETFDDDTCILQHESLKLKEGLEFPEYKAKILLMEIFYIYICNTNQKNEFLLMRKKSSSYDAIFNSIKYIHSNYAEKVTLSELAAKAFMSEDYFSREFQKYIGCSPFNYINNYRINQSLICLTETKMNIIDIAMSCGFKNVSYFNRKFKELMKCTPKEYRKSNCN